MFNRYEPIEILPLVTLLFVVPAALYPLLDAYQGILGFALIFALYHATLSTSIFLYRVSPFHPLAHYPGPFLAKITRWYWAWIALSGHQHLELYRLHEKLGDIVRIGAPDLRR